MKNLLCLLALALLVVPGRAQPHIDALQLLTDVRILAADSLEGRQVGTAGSARAQAYICTQLERHGLTPFPGGYAQPFMFVRDDTMQGVNLLGYIAGTEKPDRYFVITAHYDHLGWRHGALYNGADDNASGVAGLLALAGYFAQHPPRHSIIFAALDAEEVGLQGAYAFLKTPPVPRAHIVFNINLDMISRSVTDELFAAGAYHYPFLKPHLLRVAAGSKIRLRLGHDGSGGDDWTMSSDHGPFHRAGIPFVYFGVEDHADYHRPTDDYERIDAAFFIRAVETITEAVRTFDAHLEIPAPPASH